MIGDEFVEILLVLEHKFLICIEWKPEQQVFLCHDDDISLHYIIHKTEKFEL